jgi:hypothetical protein
MAVPSDIVQHWPMGGPGSRRADLSPVPWRSILSWMGWDESYPLSEGLAHKFSNRALDFDNLPQLVSLPMPRRSVVAIEFRASGASHA